MPQVINKRGDVINVTGLLRECPDCGAICETENCAICGWTEPASQDEPAKAKRAPEAAKPRKPSTDHIDASNELVCVICGGNKDEVGGVLQCPLCGPGLGVELPAEPPPRAAAKVLPNIDDQLPADPRCPICLARAEELAAAGDVEPHDVGEREIVVDYAKGGSVSLRCPVCDAAEELWDAKKQPVAAAVAEEKPGDVPTPAAVSGEPTEPTAPRTVPLEVRRRKKG